MVAFQQVNHGVGLIRVSFIRRLPKVAGLYSLLSELVKLVSHQAVFSHRLLVVSFKLIDQLGLFGVVILILLHQSFIRSEQSAVLK